MSFNVKLYTVDKLILFMLICVKEACINGIRIVVLLFIIAFLLFNVVKYFNFITFASRCHFSSFTKYRVYNVFINIIHIF